MPLCCFKVKFSRVLIRMEPASESIAEALMLPWERERFFASTVMLPPIPVPAEVAAIPVN